MEERNELSDQVAIISDIIFCYFFPSCQTNNLGFKLRSSSCLLSSVPWKRFYVVGDLRKDLRTWLRNSTSLLIKLEGRLMYENYIRTEWSSVRGLDCNVVKRPSFEYIARVINHCSRLSRFSIFGRLFIGKQTAFFWLAFRCGIIPFLRPSVWLTQQEKRSPKNQEEMREKCSPIYQSFFRRRDRG